MKIERLAGLIAIGMVVGFGTFAGACSSGGGKDGTVTVSAYIQSVVSVDQAHESRAAPFRTQLEEYSSLTDDALVPAEAIAAFRGLLEEEGTFIAAIEALKPPDEAAALQQEAIDALTADREASSQAVDQISGTTTIGELTQLFQADSLVQADQRRSSACLALQQFASDNSVEVDLTC